MPPDLSQLSPDQLRHLAATLMSQVEQQDRVLQERERALAQSLKRCATPSKSTRN
ncbi:MAG: hypothetical protein ABN479_20345 [Billgrantia sp.]